MEVNLYLTLSPVETVVPRLLEKVYESNARCIFRVPSETDADYWNKLLWTYKQKSFLPHGSQKDGFAEEQPIWITHLDENPNDSTVYLTVHASPQEGELPLVPESGFKKGIDVIALSEENGIPLAQKRIKEYTNKGQEIKVWRQTDEGKWNNLEPSQAEFL